MSAAPEFPPVVYIPERARKRAAGVRRPAGTITGLSVVPSHTLVCVPVDQVLEEGLSTQWSATAWHRTVAVDITSGCAPADVVASAPFRLTRRGVLVLGSLAVAAACLIAAIAWASSPAATAAPTGPASVTVHPGDTLWSVASVVAPSRDPRAEVDELTRINHLGGDAALTPGQILPPH
jgi:hypothetical protein